jgi:hypothetical protein
MNITSGILAAALMTAAAPWLALPAMAAPMSSSLELQGAAAPSVETVQYRRNWRGGYYPDAGVGLGLGIAGAIVGGAIVGATQPYGYNGYYNNGYYNNGYYNNGYYNNGYSYGGYDPGYASAPGYQQGYVAGGNAVGYCQQRFRSYDPASGTYLGFDGLRHPCP